MKKILALLLTAVLLLSTGCTVVLPQAESPASTGAPSVPASTAAPGTEAPAVTTAPELPATEPPTAPVTTDAPATAPVTTDAPATTEPEPLDPWSLMGELSFEQGSYTDGDGDTDSYSYALPCINADTPGARAINEEIEEIYGGMIQSSKEDMELGNALFLYSVGYFGEVWDDVLTLVVIAHTMFDSTQYGIYSYDCTTGRRLTTRDILARKGVSEQDFLDASRMQMINCYEEMYSWIPADERDQYGYDQGLERVDDELYLSMDLQAYLDSSGDIVIAAPVVSLAGADFYYHLLPLGFVGN